VGTSENEREVQLVYEGWGGVDGWWGAGWRVAAGSEEAKTSGR
jgi:hypothetical protein